MVVDWDNVSGPQLRPSKLAHIVLRTTDKSAMNKFYVDFLGGTVVHENPVLSFITYDDEHHRIAFAQIPGMAPIDRGSCGLEVSFESLHLQSWLSDTDHGFKHIAFTFESLEDLFLSYRQRKAKGMLPFWCVNHGMTISLYYNDPDGNVLETQCDTLSNEQANEYMASQSFQENPIGVDFDPEEMIERIKKGQSFEELTCRPDIGPRGVDTVPRPRPRAVL